MSAGYKLNDEPAILFDKVSVRIGQASILEEITAAVPRGGNSAVVGPNGAGKTTLMQALLGEVPHTGEIHLSGFRDKRKPRLGYVPQRLQFDRGMPLTVRDFLLMGLQRRPLWLGRSRAECGTVNDLLDAVQGRSLLNKTLGVLSGGELQRVLLAMALQNDPELLVLDEPAAGVDVRGGALFCEILEDLRHRRGFTQLMVSHDLSMVTHHATHVILLNRRVVAEGPPRETLTPENLSAVFGMHMGLTDARAMPEGRTHCICSAEEREMANA